MNDKAYKVIIVALIIVIIALLLLYFKQGERSRNYQQLEFIESDSKFQLDMPLPDALFGTWSLGEPILGARKVAQALETREGDIINISNKGISYNDIKFSMPCKYRIYINDYYLMQSVLDRYNPEAFNLEKDDRCYQIYIYDKNDADGFELIYTVNELYFIDSQAAYKLIKVE